MKVNELKKRLREKERELWADMTRTEAEARASGIAETQDGDAAAERKEGLFQETTSDWNVFTQVRDALQRIEKGSYGANVWTAGARLRTVGWTASRGPRIVSTIRTSMSAIWQRVRRDREDERYDRFITDRIP